MRLIDEIKQLQTTKETEAKEALQGLVKSVLPAYRTIVLQSASAGEINQSFTQMTSVLRNDLPGVEITDLHTEMYLRIIKEHFEGEGLIVDGPYRKPHTGFQMEINVRWSRRSIWSR